MRAIDKVRAAFKRDLRKLHVPEWDLDLYFGCLTVGDLEAAEQRQPKTPFERNMFLFTSCARDAEGAPLFASTDIHHLRTEADLNVISRIFEFMWRGVPDTDLAVKELGANPPSASA